MPRRDRRSMRLLKMQMRHVSCPVFILADDLKHDLVAAQNGQTKGTVVPGQDWLADHL